MRERRILIVTALPEEQRAVRQALERCSGWRRHRLQRRSLGGELDGRQVRAVCLGVGDRRATYGLASELSQDPPAEKRPLVLGVGIAGALSPGLRRGDLVWSREVAQVTPGGVERRASDASPPDASAGVLVMSKALVNAADERERLWREVGRPQRAGVDLESFAWAEAAERAGCRWAVVRAISDTVERPLPAAVVSASEDDGSVHRGRVALAALRRPGQISDLLQLGRSARRAAGCAALAAVSWLVERGAAT